MQRALQLFVYPLTIAIGLMLAAPSSADAKTSGTIGGSGAYTHKCHWVCHPRIKKARAQVCANKKGKTRLVYWETMPVPCDPNAEGD